MTTQSRRRRRQPMSRAHSFSATAAHRCARPTASCASERSRRNTASSCDIQCYSTSTSIPLLVLLPDEVRDFIRLEVQLVSINGNELQKRLALASGAVVRMLSCGCSQAVSRKYTRVYAHVALLSLPPLGNPATAASTHGSTPFLLMQVLHAAQRGRRCVGQNLDSARRNRADRAEGLLGRKYYVVVY